MLWSKTCPLKAAKLANDSPFGVGHGLDREPRLGDERHFGQTLVALRLFQRHRSRQWANRADVHHPELGRRVRRVGSVGLADLDNPNDLFPLVGVVEESV